MVVKSADEAIDNAKSWGTCSPGMCLYTVQEWLESAHMFPDAAAAWHGANYRHTDDDPPPGVPVYWTGGAHGYGHAALSLGGGRIRSTDCTSTGDVSDCDLSWPRTHWGLTYVGWAEDTAETRLPYMPPDNNGGPPMSKPIYFRRSEDYPLTADEEWHDCLINDEDDMSIVIGETDAVSCTTTILIDHLADGEYVDLTYWIGSYKSGTPTTYSHQRATYARVWGDPIAEGRVSLARTYNGSVPEDDSGRSPRLRVAYRTNAVAASLISLTVEGWT